MKKLSVILVIFMILSAVPSLASTNKPLENLSDGLDNTFYGVVEIPDNMNQTQSKGTPAYADCTASTKDDVGRGIARFVGGLWRIATFWYPEDSPSATK